MWQVVAGLAALGAALTLIGALIISTGKAAVLGRTVVPFVSPRSDESVMIKGSSLSTGLILIYLGVVASIASAVMSWKDK